MKALSDVKPGDLLIIQHRQDRRIVQVETVTSCRFKTKDGSTWDKKTAKRLVKNRVLGLLNVLKFLRKEKLKKYD